MVSLGPLQVSEHVSIVFWHATGVTLKSLYSNGDNPWEWEDIPLNAGEEQPIKVCG